MTSSIRSPRARTGAVLLALVCLLLVGVPAAQADVLAPWGSSLSATPTLDTANGASTSGTMQKPVSQGVWTDYDSSCGSCTHWMHDGADGTVWNTAVAGGQATAPQSGQVLSVTVKGCAVADPGAPSDDSQGSGGEAVPANSIQFQGLTPSGGRFTVDNTGQDTNGSPFQLPWCDDRKHPTGASANTQTTFHPLHMCINAGDIVSFYELGGYIPGANGGYYPQGVPFKVIAAVSGSHMNSMMDAGESSYGPGDRPTVNGSDNNTGWGDEQGEEVLLQVTEGVGADAYGLCPGGAADEASSSNAVNCDYSKLLAGRGSNGHPICGQTGTPTGSGSGSGTEGGSASGSTGPKPGSGATNAPATPVPVLGRLKLNPARFYAKKGSTITYADNVAGLASFVVYRVTVVRHKQKLVKVRSFAHVDHAGGQGLGGKLTRLRPGKYLLQARVAYKGKHSQLYTLRFTVLK